MPKTVSRQTIGDWRVARRLGGRGDLAALAPRRGRSYLVRRDGGDDTTIYELHCIDPRPEPLATLTAEVGRYAELRHEALPKVVDHFAVGDELAVVIEHAEGVGLDRLKGYLDRDRERLPDAAIWFVGWQAMSALARAHVSRNHRGDLAPIVHGALSLKDILVTWDGNVMLLGLCPGLHTTPTDPPSQSWLSPEVRRGGDPTPHADTYAASLVLRSLLTGRPPPSPGASFEPVARLRPEVPADVAEALDRALGRRRGHRKPTCADLAQRFETLVRITEGRRALRDCMELYQALWGLWSVAAPDLHSLEEPLPLAQKLPGIGPVIREVEELDDDRLDAEGPPSSLRALGPPSSLGEHLDGPPSSPRAPGAASAASDGAVDDGSSSAPGGAEAGEESSPETSRSPGGTDGGDDWVPAPAQAGSATSVARGEKIEVPSDETPRDQGNGAPGDDDGGEAVIEVGEIEELPYEIVSAEDDLPSDDRASHRPAEAVAVGRPEAPASMRWAVALAVLGAVALAVWLSARRPSANAVVDGASATTDAPPSDPAPAPPTVSGAPTASSTLTASPGGEGGGSVVPEPAPKEPPPPPAPKAVEAVPRFAPPEVSDVEEASALRHDEGYLVVQSSVDAVVSVQGLSLGRTNERILSRCNHRFIRLGEPHKWLTEGRSVILACGKLTTVRIEPTIFQ
jgi:hypothetical protein